MAKFYNPVTENTTTGDYFNKFLPEFSEYLQNLGIGGYFNGTVKLLTSSELLLLLPQEVDVYEVYHKISREHKAKEFEAALTRQHSLKPNSHFNYQMNQFPPPGPYTAVQLAAERSLVFISDSEAHDTLRGIDPNFQLPAPNAAGRVNYLRNAANSIPGSIVTSYTTTRTVGNVITPIDNAQRARASAVVDLDLIDDMRIFSAESSRLALISVPNPDPALDSDAKLIFFKSNLIHIRLLPKEEGEQVLLCLRQGHLITHHVHLRSAMNQQLSQFVLASVPTTLIVITK